jgi:hypothetical protein
MPGPSSDEWFADAAFKNIALPAAKGPVGSDAIGIREYSAIIRSH